MLVNFSQADLVVASREIETMMVSNYLAITEMTVHLTSC